ncbi:MAG: methyltransferase domain-containing protein [Deltaproteobacteria bacterium]|nr:methyltransferase domain-containing protein [Deltaproteobacteria bacterium]
MAKSGGEPRPEGPPASGHESPEQRLRQEEERLQAAYARRSCGDLYSCFNPGHLFLVQQREQRMLELLRRHGFARLEDRRILEIGCGEGFWINEFIKWGAKAAHITAVDLIWRHVELTRARTNEEVTLICANAASLDLPDASFDLVLQATVFTSILDPAMKARVAGEMVRLLKPGGLILWYDYHVDNPANPDVKGVKKAEIHRLFPGCRIELERLTLAPPLCRALAPYSFLLCHLLAKIPFLCTHYLGAIRKAKA